MSDLVLGEDAETVVPLGAGYVLVGQRGSGFGVGELLDDAVAVEERDALYRCQGRAVDARRGSMEADAAFQSTLVGGRDGEVCDCGGSLDRGGADNFDVVDEDVVARAVADLMDAEIAWALSEEPNLYWLALRMSDVPLGTPLYVT